MEHQQKVVSIIRLVTAPLSIIASMTIIVMIHRSARRFSAIQNRLLFGLSVADIVTSLAMCLGVISIPRGTPMAWVPLGNRATCEAQGFCLIVGLFVTPSYNASLCIFYVLRIRYNMSDEYIQARVEPFLHGIPILLGSIVATASLTMEQLNQGFGLCAIADFPLGCSARPDVACERGEDFVHTWPFLVMLVTVFFLVPLLIIGSMFTAYITVLRQERRMSAFGIGSLQSVDSNTDRFGRSYNSVRVVMDRALAYSIAWVLSFIFPATFQFRRVFRTSEPPNFTLMILMAIFHPLQGVFNFVVFLYPKYTEARRRNPELSCMGIFKAAMASNQGGGTTTLARSPTRAS